MGYFLFLWVLQCGQNIRNLGLLGSTMSRFCKHRTAKPSGMPHSPAVRGAREYFISARNNQNPDKICRGFVFSRIPATFSPQGYQYVQRCKFVDFYDGYATVDIYINKYKDKNQ